ncbi:hypothetical protein [Bordetella genomosp. 5]|uniref:hypothetical protein n=1 Tax=Bordetella genomosp. 5 TaxID=1395608 RepID=UPI0020CFB8D3|nr:hypothetical protein [Bordetella genomosp. 5]
MKIPRLSPLALPRHAGRLALPLVLPLLAACAQAQVADPAYAPGYDPAYDAAYPAAQGTDPATANMAPVSISQEAPPPLPAYQQPPVPGDGYIWVPGYWARNAIGFYWVPGAWVIAPYAGALWTPGYWAYDTSYYRWNPGYWGPHVGFYGGINYGYGYLGFGYVGGYWNADRFYYNRAVTMVNVTRVKYVYDRRIDVHDYDRGRISYHGGPRGIQRAPSPQELAARNERHRPPTQAQFDHARWAGNERGQRYGHGNGPARMADDRPIGGPRDGRRWDDGQPGRGNVAQGGRPGQEWSTRPNPQRPDRDNLTPNPNRPDNGQLRPNPNRPDGGQLTPRPQPPLPNGHPGFSRPAPTPSPTRPETWRGPDNRPGQGRPDTARPDSGRPDTGRPDSGRPDAARPGATRPDAARPSRPRPDGGQPGAGGGSGRPQAERPPQRESRPPPQREARPQNPNAGQPQQQRGPERAAPRGNDRGDGGGRGGGGGDRGGGGGGGGGGPRSDRG